MTREEIDATLAALARREGFDGVKQLALIVANQEARLRVLEPCPWLGIGGPHVWRDGEPVCRNCGVKKAGV